MCGITGFISDKKNKKKILKSMSDRIIHRGPDSSGEYIDDDVALGHRRLSIIDLEGGKQPIYNEDESMVIVFNGEIYNYKVLKKELEKLGHTFKTNSDTEVIIHGYEQWQDEVVKKLRGMFAFAIWKKEDKSLFIARDGFGIKQVYYYYEDEVFMFGSEIKCFLGHPDFNKVLNEEIISSYLCFNSVPTEETLFKGVFRVEPGHTLLFKNGEITKNCYFKLEFEEGKIDGDITEQINDAVEDSVEHHKIADVEVGSFLSSGVDSSYLVSAGKPDKTYTVGYDDPKYDETKYAKDLTDKLGVHNKSRKISKEEYLEVFPKMMYHMDEPIADPASAALYFLAQSAAEDVKVVMSGEGADEFFGGYNSYMEDIDNSIYMKLPFFIRRGFSNIASIFPDARGFNYLYRRGKKLEEYHIGLGRVFRDKEASSIVLPGNQIHTKDIVKPFYEDYKDNSTIVQRQVIDYYFWLVRDFLHLVDRNTMMFGLEARVPFLDKSVYDVARKLSPEHKLKKGETKIELRKAASVLIPNDAHKKKKLGFPVPLREWVKEDLFYENIKLAFNSDEGRRYFDNKKIIKLLEDHRKGKKDNYKKIWCIYTFIVWYNQFFKEEENV